MLRPTVGGERSVAAEGSTLRELIQNVDTRHPGFAGQLLIHTVDLLKLLVALGGSDVDAQQLTASLWPDADGAAAKSSFDSALFRLRKLLDIENVITLSAGKLSLDDTA